MAIQRVDEAGDVGRMGELLVVTFPGPGKTDWRGFEWYVFWRRYQGARPIRTLPLSDGVWDLAATPNGQTVAILGLRSPQRQGPGHPLGCRDRPGAADVRGASRSSSRAPWPCPRTEPSSPRGASSTPWDMKAYFVNIWDAATGELLQSLGGPDGHSERRSSALAFSPDGKTLVSGSEDKTIKLWDLETGHVLKTFEGHTGLVRGVAFSPDGRRIASVSQDMTVKLWDVESGDALFTSPKLSQIPRASPSPPATAGTSPRGALGRGPGCGT